MPARTMASPAFPRNWRKKSRPRSAMKKPPRPSRARAPFHGYRIKSLRSLVSGGLLAPPGLIFGMGTADEYIHEPPRTLGPIRTGGNARNTDKSPEQVEGL